MNEVELSATPKGVGFRVRVRPKAGRDQLQGIHDGALKLAVRAAPERNRANLAIVRLLAGILEVASDDVEIVAGQTSRVKSIRVRGLALPQVRQRLERHLPG